MIKRITFLISILTASALLTAMGGGKGGGIEKAPRVDKNFAVVVADLSGNKIEGDKFSWEGRTHLSGYQGLAQVTIPFGKVKGFSFGDKKERKVKVTVALKDGGETVIDVDADSRCYGEAGFGSFMLLIDEIKTVTFKE